MRITCEDVTCNGACGLPIDKDIGNIKVIEYQQNGVRMKVIEHPNDNKPMRIRCNHCTALLEFTVAEVVRIKDASYVTCPVCSLEVTIRTAVSDIKYGGSYW